MLPALSFCIDSLAASGHGLTQGLLPGLRELPPVVKASLIHAECWVHPLNQTGPRAGGCTGWQQRSEGFSSARQSASRPYKMIDLLNVPKKDAGVTQI